MAGVRVGKALVVEVMHQAGDPPQLLVLTVAAGIAAHRRLHAEHVLSQRIGLDPFADQAPSVLARRFSHQEMLRAWPTSTSFDPSRGRGTRCYPSPPAEWRNSSSRAAPRCRER